MISIKYLSWDSDFFHKKIGAIVLTNNTEVEISKIPNLQNQENYDLLYIITPTSISYEPFNMIGAKLMDRKVTYRKDILSCKKTNNTLVSYNQLFNQDLLELAFESGHKSRFKTDPILGQQFKKMYQIWLEKSLSRELADEVFITKDKNKIIGFVTVKKK